VCVPVVDSVAAFAGVLLAAGGPTVVFLLFLVVPVVAGVPAVSGCPCYCWCPCCCWGSCTQSSLLFMRIWTYSSHVDNYLTSTVGLMD